MRLINVDTLELEEHIALPRYAILSHTWRDGEVLFAEYGTGREKNKAGYRKISYLCAQAKVDDIQYAWIDTVCIDKSSSAELSEAINSMFSWYQNAERCYVYLDDVVSIADIPNSRWITRAWTLQELIAPYHVYFFAKNWDLLGTKLSLTASLVEYTGIEQFILTNGWLGSVSVAERMSWAAKRQATRVEDVAYCLFGIFNVNLPLLYGEGMKAFQRLQHEILRQSQDMTIFAFDHSFIPMSGPSLFASEPSDFRRTARIIRESRADGVALTSEGLEVSLQLLKGPEANDYWVNLGCRFEFDRQNMIALRTLRDFPDIRRRGENLITFPGPLVLVPREKWVGVSKESIILREKTSIDVDYNAKFRNLCVLEAELLVSHGFKVISTELEDGVGSWNADAMASEVVTINPVLVRKFGFVHTKHDEAFIVGVVDVVDEDRRSRDLLLFVKVKPRKLDCARWLSDEGIHDVIKPLSRGEGQKLVAKLQSSSDTTGSVTWKRMGLMSEIRGIYEVRLDKNVPLLSQKCFQRINVAARTDPYRPGYAVKVYPGAYHAEL